MRAVDYGYPLRRLEPTRKSLSMCHVDGFLAMPNNVHGILVLTSVGAGPGACPVNGQPRGVAPTGEDER